MRETKTTFCRICEVGCGLKVTVENNRVIEIKPDEEHVVSQGYACVKGLSLGHFNHTPDRLTHPLKRVDGELKRISWRQALQEIGEKVAQLKKEKGPDSIALYLGNPISMSLLPPMLATGFLKGIGSRNLFQTGSQDCNNKFVVTQRMYGMPFTQPFPDIDHTKFLIIVGGNPAVSKMSFIQLPRPTQRLQAIEERGGRVVIIDPRRTESAKKMGEHHFIRPSTDVFFMLGFLNELIRQNGIDGDRISKHMKHFETLKEVASSWTAERVAEVTGIAADNLRQLVAHYIEADGASIYSSTGVNQGGNGVLTFWLQECINAVSGNLDRRGGSLVGRGIADLPALGAKRKIAMGEERSRIGDLPSAVDSFPAAIMADEILTPGPNQVRALFVASGNPLLTVPNGNHLAEALEDLELLVCTDIQRSETTEYADYILPATTFLQRPDLPFLFHSMMGMQPTPFIQYTDAVLKPDGEQRDELWMFSQLARVSGSPMFGSRLFQSILNLGYYLGSRPLLRNWLTPAHERLLGLVTLFTGQGSLRKLRKSPHGKLLKPQTPESFLGQRVLTDDGKVDLAPQEIVSLSQRLEGLFEQELAQADCLKLISKRERYSHNSWTHNIERMVKGDRNTNYVYMHPQDAQKRSLTDGDLAEVETKTAVITLPVRITEDMMPGAVAVPHGWGHKEAEGLSIAKRNPGANVNLLAADGPESVEPISGMAHLTGFIVDVRAAH